MLEAYLNMSPAQTSRRRHDLLKIFELQERLTVAKVLIEHLKERREIRYLLTIRRQN